MDHLWHGMAGVLTRCLLVAHLVLSAGCVSDGAVRLARCIERAAAKLESSKEAEIREQCDLRVGGASKVVAFPSSAVSSARLKAEGLAQADIRTLNELQIGDSPYARLNVLPASRRPRPSRTTYHRRFVETPALLVCWAPTSTVTIVLRREPGWTALAKLECR